MAQVLTDMYEAFHAATNSSGSAALATLAGQAATQPTTTDAIEGAAEQAQVPKQSDWQPPQPSGTQFIHKAATTAHSDQADAPLQTADSSHDDVGTSTQAGAFSKPRQHTSSKSHLDSESAPISVDVSVFGMLQCIQSLTLQSSGSFLKYDGTAMPW